MSYLDILNKADKDSTTSLMWGIASEGSLWVSNIGYNHQEHMDIEESLLKAGCRHDFSKGIGKFSRDNGRTTSWFKLPKAGAQ